jgi:hypothetical protein
MNMRTYRLKIYFQSAAQSFLSKNSPKPTKPKIIILKTNSIFFFVNLEIEVMTNIRRILLYAIYVDKYQREVFNS